MRTRLLLVALAALVLARPVSAAPPPVQARPWLVTDASTGEVLAAHDAHARVPIASITKLMTVLVATKGRPLGTPITVDSDAAAVGESSVELRTGERLPLRDLVEAAL